MSTTQFSELLTQASRLDQRFSGAFSSAESERTKACEELVSALDKQVLAEKCGKQTVAYHALRGDALAYMAAISEGDARKKSSDLAVRAYMNASSLAITDLSIIHPDRLRLALNYSTFLHDIAEETDQACYVAKRAMDNARAEADSRGTDIHPDSVRCIELLHKRIDEWISASKADSGVDDD